MNDISPTDDIDIKVDWTRDGTKNNARLIEIAGNVSSKSDKSQTNNQARNGGTSDSLKNSYSSETSEKKGKSMLKIRIRTIQTIRTIP